MRIAVSGSHCTGKSTLIDAFLHQHPEFIHEPEPYEAMGEEFLAEPSVEDFLRQLEFNIERLKQYEPGTKVIFERCPLDFAAYIQCLSKTTTIDLTEALQHLDLIVYLPIEFESPDEFPKLRKAVDRRLSAFYEDTDITVIEASGPTDKRLRLLETAFNEL